MRPPNLLWVVTTQWRRQALGCAGDPNASTPSLDRWAARGRRFTHACTPHPFGPFARAALLTGQCSPANGLRDYFDPLPPDRPTIAPALQQRGYRTGFFGKWHLSRRDPHAPLVGEAHARTVVPANERGGFEHWEGFESGFLLNDPWLHGTSLPEPQRFRGYQSDVLVDRALSWCARPPAAASGDVARPWFAMVSLEPPHPPYAAPAPGARTLGPHEVALRENVPLGGEVEAKARTELAGYYAHLAATDRALGRLLAALEGTPTIAVFTSVHGDMHGGHGVFRKGWPYEESVGVPLIVASLGEGATEAALPAADALVSLVDLPTWALGWADQTPVPPARAVCEISMPSVVRLPLQCDRIWRGVRTRDQKLVLNEDGTPWLFFDLASDPLELRNLADDPRVRPAMDALRAQYPAA